MQLAVEVDGEHSPLKRTRTDPDYSQQAVVGTEKSWSEAELAVAEQPDLFQDPRPPRPKTATTESAPEKAAS